MCIETPPSAQRSFELHNDDAVVNYDGINKRKSLLQPRSFSASPKKNEFTLLGVHEEPPAAQKLCWGAAARCQTSAVSARASPAKKSLRQSAPVLIFVHATRGNTTKSLTIVV
jgi:hypothetical protein